MSPLLLAIALAAPSPAPSPTFSIRDLPTGVPWTINFPNMGMLELDRHATITPPLKELALIIRRPNSYWEERGPLEWFLFMGHEDRRLLAINSKGEIYLHDKLIGKDKKLGHTIYELSKAYR